MERIIRELWDGKEIAVDTALLTRVGSLLEGQVTDGFGQTFAQVDFSTPDAAMLTRLTRNTWTFSAAKNYQQLRDMTLALRDAEGKLRLFNKYKEIASSIDDQFNTQWLRTEYNLAVGSATMASHWNEFEKNAADMPYLQYKTASDERVRSEHQLLDGVIRKITDAFWSSHYPPNGYGCRCDVIQLAASYATETENIPDITIPRLFRTNLAQTGLIYPSGHPYYDGVPPEILRNAINYLPPEAAYKTISKGVKMHLLHGMNEMENNVATARILAGLNYNVKLLPILDKKSDAAREFIYGTKDFIKGKNPDALIGKELFDFKRPDNAGKNGIHSAIRNGQRHADNIIIRLPEKMTEKEIERAVKGKLNQAKYADTIWVINKEGKPLKYDRKSLGLPPKAKRPDK